MRGRRGGIIGPKEAAVSVRWRIRRASEKAQFAAMMLLVGVMLAPAAALLLAALIAVAACSFLS